MTTRSTLFGETLEAYVRDRQDGRNDQHRNVEIWHLLAFIAVWAWSRCRVWRNFWRSSNNPVGRWDCQGDIGRSRRLDVNRRRRVFIAMEKRVNLSRTVKLEGGSGQARESGSPEQFVNTPPALLIVVCLLMTQVNVPPSPRSCGSYSLGNFSTAPRHGHRTTLATEGGHPPSTGLHPIPRPASLRVEGGSSGILFDSVDGPLPKSGSNDSSRHV